MIASCKEFGSKDFTPIVKIISIRRYPCKMNKTSYIYSIRERSMTITIYKSIKFAVLTWSIHTILNQYIQIHRWMRLSFI